MNTHLHPVIQQALAPYTGGVGLHSLIIPAQSILSDALETDTARRLIAKGASLYIVGSGAVLSMVKPSGGIKMGVGK